MFHVFYVFYMILQLLFIVIYNLGVLWLFTYRWLLRFYPCANLVRIIVIQIIDLRSKIYDNCAECISTILSDFMSFSKTPWIFRRSRFAVISKYYEISKHQHAYPRLYYIQDKTIFTEILTLVIYVTFWYP